MIHYKLGVSMVRSVGQMYVDAARFVENWFPAHEQLSNGHAHLLSEPAYVMLLGNIGGLYFSLEKDHEQNTHLTVYNSHSENPEEKFRDMTDIDHPELFGIYLEAKNRLDEKKKDLVAA